MKEIKKILRVENENDLNKCVMKLNENNFKHTGSICPACKTSEYTLYDEFHGETYCTKCGLVLHDANTRNSIVEHKS